jgi:hypothetical protein
MGTMAALLLKYIVLCLNQIKHIFSGDIYHLFMVETSSFLKCVVHYCLLSFFLFICSFISTCEIRYSKYV